ncbi:MerR family transcriptional regulator [Allokutzneria sp. NRRL B-24872]|uniref:MerR family transcriptional regulator n=1 Tax=Allokutzneria sp. NRRL B-24872 TaxID=1137961 RepID=UPI000A398BD3|nr:MerR family transcriptional regulator [Allokutzneria sp. NRRL B-24872]
MDYTVGQVAALANVTVRTLHHYDEIGLLSPSGRTPAGYRTYGEADLDQLHRVLAYKELGFPLEEIAAIVSDPDTDTMGHLRKQRDLLLSKVERLRGMVVAVDRELESRRMGVTLTPEERFEVFGDWEPVPGYGEEAERRWGQTEQWRQAQDRMGSFDKEDFARMQTAQAEWVRELLAAVDEGSAADGERAMDLAERHRQLIGLLYDCSPAQHVGITRMYVSEPEQLNFLVSPDLQRPGLGAFICAAAQANAKRMGE